LLSGGEINSKNQKEFELKFGNAIMRDNKKITIEIDTVKEIQKKRSERKIHGDIIL
jgi:hypothetical protein